MAVDIDAKQRRAFNNTLKTARIGLPESQYEVGLMYANGVGVEQDLEQALIWLRQSAERGFAAAQYLLATRCASGTAAELDGHQAFRWFTKAAEQGHPKAIFRLGKFYSASHQDLARSCFTRAQKKSSTSHSMNRGWPVSSS